MVTAGNSCRYFTSNSTGNSLAIGRSCYLKGNSTAVTETCSCYRTFPSSDGKGNSVTAKQPYSNYKEKKKNSYYIGIRAREPLPACHFLPNVNCSDACGYWSQDAQTCLLLDDVPDGADPREWYIDWLAQAVMERGGAQ